MQTQDGRLAGTSAAEEVFQGALAEQLKLYRSREVPHVAAGVAGLLAVAYEAHASLVRFLLLPTALSLDSKQSEVRPCWIVCPCPERMLDWCVARVKAR